MIEGIDSHFGRVVKAWDLKSHGVTRAGSNPADDAFFFNFVFLIYLLLFNFNYKINQIHNLK